MFGSLMLLSGIALFSSAVTSSPLAAPPESCAPQLFSVIVGSLEGNLIYTPPYITGARPGDVVAFTFSRRNHTVTQSSFEYPCTSLEGGFDTGFTHAVEDGQAVNGTFTVNVTSEEPTWVYCRQTGACGKGMVFAINPNEDQTFEEFLERAKAFNSSSNPPSSSTPPYL